MCKVLVTVFAWLSALGTSGFRPEPDCFHLADNTSMAGLARTNVTGVDGARAERSTKTRACARPGRVGVDQKGARAACVAAMPWL